MRPGRKMGIAFVAPELRRMDELRSEALLIPFFEDERPLRGALGLVDWRLCGFVSRLVLAGRIRGMLGEQVLIPLRAKLPFDKLLLFGLGSQSDFEVETFDGVAQQMFRALGGCRVRSSAVVLPGRSTQRIDPGVAMERFVLAAQQFEEQDELTVVDLPDEQRAMGAALEQVRRRERAYV